MSISNTYHRSKLLKTTSDKGYSTSLRHEIMVLIGNISPDRKEEIAQKAIAIVEQSKTEQEALNRITELTKQA